jgi:glyoxylase-like metal-dependent hydrolase (beta-lactamase superfamily II)
LTASGLFERVGSGVFAVDTEHVRPRMDASYLIVDHGRAGFVDTGTHHSVPNLMRALAAQELDADAVDYILLTHIHLDHAGGAGRLAQQLPQARVVVHPRGAAHLVDPARLIGATKSVYGEAMFDEHYHDLAPIAPERIVTASDGLEIPLGERRLRVVHTPGHALHHVCFHDPAAQEVFCGDTFGVSYRELDTAAGAFIFPTTSPSQFDPVQLHASIRRILGLRAACAYLTHYGRVDGIGALATQPHADIDAFVAIARAASSTGGGVADLEAALFAHLSRRLDAHGERGTPEARHRLLDGDVTLNAAGLIAWLARRPD